MVFNRHIFLVSSDQECGSPALFLCPVDVLEAFATGVLQNPQHIHSAVLTGWTAPMRQALCWLVGKHHCQGQCDLFPFGACLVGEPNEK